MSEDILLDLDLGDTASEGVSKVASLDTLSVESFLGKSISSGLAFDMSKTSTGVTVFRNGVVKTYCFKLETKDEDSTYPIGLRMLEIEDALKQILDDWSFDIICVEEALSLVNPQVNAVAYALNIIPDYFLAKGILKLNEGGSFVRVNNTSWKKELRDITGVSTKVKQFDVLEQPKKPTKSDMDKQNAINCLKIFNCPLAFSAKTYRTWSGYLNSGNQDRLDSLGILIGAVNQIFNKHQRVITKVTKRQKVFDNLESAIKFAKFPIQEVSLRSNQIHKWFNEVNKNTYESTSYLVKTKNLGRFGVSKKYLFAADMYYLMVNVEVKASGGN